MSTQSTQVLDRAIKLISEGPFDLSTYEACAATALYRAATEQHHDADLGEIDAPAGEYAALLDHVCEANHFAFDFDSLTTLHGGLWKIMQEDGMPARRAALVACRRALHAERSEQVLLAT